jgi:hypothetical protein
MLIESPLNSLPLAFPVFECIHIIAFTFSVGTVALVDLRLMGIGMTDQSPAGLWADTRWWTLGGLIAIAVSGLLLFSSDPDNYYLNYAFLAKMVFLLLAIVYNYTAVRKTAAASSAIFCATSKSIMVGAISLGLWACVAFGGIFIGVLPPGLDSNPF